ncbi:MAG: hypothetical protein IKJ35_00860 [Clostridia bacterium]|nr:hypothetical protein [Clostridia bacterium]
MSKIKPERARVKEVFDGFGGIAPDGLSTGKATDMRNFRLLPNGSIEKRCGWNVQMTLSGEVRALWQGVIGGTGCIFAVSGDTIYRLQGDRQDAVGVLTESAGHAEFVFYRGRLYLLDENEIYVYSENHGRFDVANGYAPLMGVDWHPTDFGDTHEPLNLFSRRLRVNYLNTVGATSFVLPFYAESIDCVRVDNVRVNDYSFQAGSDTVTLSQIGSRVEIAFTMNNPPMTYLNLHQCTRASVERFGMREVMMMYGNQAGSNLFCTARIDENMINYCKVAYPDTDPIYVKWEGEIAVGDSLHPITTLYRLRDRMLAFHSLGATAIIPDEESDEIENYALLRGVGCTAAIDLRLDGDPVILNENGVFRLKNTGGDPDDILLERLSDGMESMLTPSFLEHAVAISDQRHGELWFRDAKDTEGVVWVYQTERKQWYCFDNVRADFFLTLDGEICFVSSHRICRFDDFLGTDDGAAITSFWESSVLGFSSPETLKRALRMTLCAKQGGGNVTAITLASERRAKTVTVHNLPGGTSHLIDFRVPFGRFRLLRVSIEDRGRNCSRYDRLAFFANS